MKYILTSAFLLLFFNLSYCQKIEYFVATIPDSLKLNANAVVRLDQTDIHITSQRNMNIKNKRIVTILNEKGISAIHAIEHYDKRTTVNHVDATVYNSFGKEIKSLKRKDFKDQAAIDGVTMFSDSRVVYLEYTPTEYPFTIVYESEVQTSNTALIPHWFPINEYYVSIEKSLLNVNCNATLGLKKKELNFDNFRISKINDSSTKLSYETTNLVPQKPEDYSPNSTVFPELMIGLESFNLEGVDGNAKTWKEYGKWFFDEVLSGTTELADETKSKINLLVGDEKDPIKKAQIIYKYVQEKSRYISIQVGIGGFKPMLAKDVDKLGYGDCKALSNYTRALLNSVGVTSYYTELYAGNNKKDIQPDFFSIQGNHVILAIPNANDYIFLECTSQEDPFGYQGTFTDDRNVLVVKPDGGEIVRTKVYSDKENSQISKGSYSLSENGDLLGSVAISSEGSQYSRKFVVEKMSPLDKETYYKEYWDNISNLKILKTTFLNDKEKISFIENIDISAVNYASLNTNRIMFAVNIFNKYNGTIKKIRNRKNGFEIQRGYYDEDEIEINLPEKFIIEASPNNVEISTKFGDYKTEIIKKANDKLIYKRTILIRKGLYSKAEYDEYRLFMEQVSRNDNSKIILIKQQ
jgi:transglutaminase-like putative cysteine protease